MRPSLLLALLAAVALAACNVNPHPGPISNRAGEQPTGDLAVQLDRLNARSAKLPLIKAVAPLNQVTIRFIDDNKKPRKEDADGTLWIRQHPDASPPTADVIFYCYVGGGVKAVFQAGKNSTDWWAIMWLDPQHAWTGKVKNLAQSSDAQASILRVDRVLDVLALVPIRPEKDVAMSMSLSDDKKSNLIRFERVLPSPDGSPPARVLERELTIDRKSGLPSDVRLFDHDGNVVVKSRLDTYRDVSYDDPKQSPADKKLPQMPHHIILEYPAANSSIELNFANVTVPAGLKKPDLFDTPNWEDADLKPEVIQ